jgi:hypothetical protein
MQTVSIDTQFYPLKYKDMLKKYIYHNKLQTMMHDWDNLPEINCQRWHVQKLLFAKDVKPQRLEGLIAVDQNVQILISVDDGDQLG